MDQQKLPLPRYVVAKEVPSLGNARMQGRSLLVGLVGGGVRVEPENLVNTALTSDLVVPTSFAQSATELKALSGSGTRNSTCTCDRNNYTLFNP